jgi:hypothetical protein
MSLPEEGEKEINIDEQKIKKSNMNRQEEKERVVG